MSNIAIAVENLSKSYFIGHSAAQKRLHPDMREVLARNARNFARKTRDLIAGRSLIQGDAVEEFWALRDVSFEIKCGERLGIIGRNGAGKSTLLKILSRITEPSKGRVQITGRVASLLEIGTGFHSELTGRENIFLNGAILGMSRREIQSKFDEIVDFAEVERFLDTPVKRYSSGMYMRLAFAVAAHLEPDILIVDEVLAVGDAQFQKKCLGKMQEAGVHGRTVLFVSHNMQAIRQLCSRTILFQSGQLALDAPSQEAIVCHLHDDAHVETSLEEIILHLPFDPAFRLEGIRLTQNGIASGTFVESGKPLEIEIQYRVLEKTMGLRIYFDIFDDGGMLLFRSFHDEVCTGILPAVEPGYYSSRVAIPDNLLGPIRYELVVNAGIFNVRNCLPDAGIRIPFKVELTGRYNQAYLGDTFRGRIALALDWTTERHA